MLIRTYFSKSASKVRVISGYNLKNVCRGIPGQCNETIPLDVIKLQIGRTSALHNRPIPKKRSVSCLTITLRAQVALIRSEFSIIRNRALHVPCTFNCMIAHYF